MRPPLSTVRVLGHGRAWPLLLWPTVSALVVFAISLMILTPAFGALERSHRVAATPPPMPAAPGSIPSSPPNFTVAVGTDDEPSEMPAIQSAKTDFLAFSDQFADFLEHGAAAPDFGTEERALSPAAARRQVTDGTSVLAVILPSDLTPDIMSDIRQFRAGSIEAPTYTITIVAGPQALNEDSFILSEYRSQVITQAVERVSDQIRTVASKSDCVSMRVSPCVRSQDETTKAFETPFTISVDKVSGPAAVDYFGDKAGAAGTKATTASPGPTATSAATPSTAATSAQEPASMLVWVAAVLSALVIAAALLALAASAMVNRSAGLQLIIIGPWRSLTPQRPFSRRSLFTAKLVIGALGCLVLVAVAATTLFALSSLYGSAGIGLRFGAYPVIRLLAVVGFLVLLSAGATSAVLAVGDVVGGGFGVLAALLGAGLGLGTSGIGPSLGLPGGVNGGAGSAGVLSGLTTGSLSSLPLTGAVPTILALAALCVVSIVAGLLVTGSYDSRVSTQITLNDR